MIPLSAAITPGGAFSVVDGGGHPLVNIGNPGSPQDAATKDYVDNLVTGTTIVTQETWFVDPVGGNDANDGLTSGTAIKTFKELNRRWGATPFFKATTSGFITVTALADGPESDPLNLTGDLAADTNILIKGTVTTTRTGTMPTVTAMNPAANQAWEIVDSNSSHDWTSEIGLRVRVTSGPNANQIAWIVKDLGTGRARVSQPALNDAPTVHGYHGPTIGVFSNGNAYVVESMSAIYIGNVIRLGREDAPSAVHAGRIFFQDLSVLADQGRTTIQQCVSIGFIGCNILALLVTQAYEPAVINCCIGVYGASVNACLLSAAAGCSLGGLGTETQATILANNYLLQDVGTYLGGGLIVDGPVGIFDVIGSAGIEIGNLELGPGYFYASAACYGSGNESVGINVSPGSQLWFDPSHIPTVTGAGGDFAIDSIPQSWSSPVAAAMGSGFAASHIFGKDGIAHIVSPEVQNEATPDGRGNSREDQLDTTDGTSRPLATINVSGSPNAAIVLDVIVMGVQEGAVGARWFKKSRAWLNTGGVLTSGTQRDVDSEALGTPTTAWTVSLTDDGAQALKVMVNGNGAPVRWYVVSQRLTIGAAS